MTLMFTFNLCCDVTGKPEQPIPGHHQQLWMSKRERGPQTKEEGQIPQEGETDILDESFPVTFLLLCPFTQN